MAFKLGMQVHIYACGIILVVMTVTLMQGHSVSAVENAALNYLDN